MEAGESHIINNYKVDIINCEHPVTSVGYLFSEKRSRLKDEFKGRPGKELGELRKKGVELNEDVFLPLFAFLGDTTDKVFQDYGEQLLRYPVIFVECTFFTPDHKEAAAGSLHNHWEYVLDFNLQVRSLTSKLKRSQAPRPQESTGDICVDSLLEEISRQGDFRLL